MVLIRPPYQSWVPVSTSMMLLAYTTHESPWNRKGEVPRQSLSLPNMWVVSWFWVVFTQPGWISFCCHLMLSCVLYFFWKVTLTFKMIVIIDNLKIFYYWQTNSSHVQTSPVKIAIISSKRKLLMLTCFSLLYSGHSHSLLFKADNPSGFPLWFFFYTQ